MDYLFSYLIYLSLLSCVILLSHLTANKYHNKELSFGYDNYTKIKFNHFLSLVFIAFIVGFRYKVGTDWEGYKLYFEYGNFNAGKIEFGYRMINSLIFKLKGSYEVAFFVVSFLSWYLIFKAFPIQLLSLGVYFLFCDEWFFFSTNGVRQFIAFGFFIFSIKFLINHNFKLYIAFTFIAGLFHSSAFALIPLFIIPWKKLYNRNIWLTLYSISFIFSQNSFLIELFSTTFKFLADKVPIFNYYLIYITEITYTVGKVSLGNYGLVFRVLITVLIIFYSKPILKKYPKTITYYGLFFLGSVVTSLFVAIPLISRFAIYFTFFRPLLLALTVYFIFNERNYAKTRLLGIAIIILYFVLFLNVISISEYDFTFFQS